MKHYRTNSDKLYEITTLCGRSVKGFPTVEHTHDFIGVTCPDCMGLLANKLYDLLRLTPYIKPKDND